MNEEEKSEEQQFHRKFAVDTFNLVWSLLDKDDRTKEDEDKMVNAAHTSRFHWGEIGTPMEFERGEWQISRVYSVLKRPEEAVLHAQRCLEICEENHIGDFDIAFAYEANARALSVAGQSAQRDEYIQKAKEAGEQIEKQEDKDYFFSELKTVAGYTD